MTVQPLRTHDTIQGTSLGDTPLKALDKHVDRVCLAAGDGIDAASAETIKKAEIEPLTRSCRPRGFDGTDAVIGAGH